VLVVPVARTVLERAFPRRYCGSSTIVVLVMLLSSTRTNTSSSSSLAGKSFQTVLYRYRFSERATAQTRVLNTNSVP
jgi:hypothetical protein